MSSRSSQLDIINTLSACSKSVETKAAKSTKPDFSATFSVPYLDADDFPQITYWTQKKYHAAKKEKKGFTNLHHQAKSHGNTMTWYVQDINSNTITSQEVEQYCIDARSIWQYLLNNDMAPKTWANANLAAMNYYEHHMCSHHPEFSYGANNWKAHQIAIDNYPSWAAGHLSCLFRGQSQGHSKKCTKMIYIFKIAFSALKEVTNESTSSC